MCKVFGFSNFSKVKKKLETIEFIGQTLLDTERDGFGYAIWNNNISQSFGERTSDKTFRSGVRENPRVNFDFCVKPETNQNMFGEFDLTNVGAAIFHGRISTNNKNLLNTHPMVRDGWALVHNGVVTDHGEKYDTITTNDSEHVLKRYQDGTFEQNLTGYYAFLALDDEGKLHVCRDRIAQLYSAWVDQLDSYVFSTTEFNISKVCKALGVEHSNPLKLKDDVLIGAIH